MLSTSPLVAFAPATDLARAKALFGGTLGLKLLSEDAFGLVFAAPGAQLRIAAVGTFTPQRFTIAGWTVPDLAATVQELAARGAACLRVPGLEQDALGIWTAPGGAKVAWFKDPDGNTLSLTQAAA